MPRIRSIKPDFFVDEDIGRLPPITRVIYAGLWCHADKAGRLEYRPEYLKTQIIPYDQFDMSKEIGRLCSPKTRTGIPFTLKYEVEGVPFLQIIAWEKHQKPHSTEYDSKLPEPPKDVVDKLFNGRGTVKERLTNGTQTIGKERKGREGKGAEANASAVAILDYLNKTAETSFESATWVSLINTRINEGFVPADFQKVIDLKVTEWGNHPKMSKYLRPATLFTKAHMEEYINEANRQPKRRSDM